jgi:hypothetical protein
VGPGPNQAAASQQLVCNHGSGRGEVDHPKRLGEPDAVHRSGVKQQAGRLRGVNAGQPLPEGRGHDNAFDTPITTNDRNGGQGRIPSRRWYAAQHGKGKATQTPRPPQQGEPRPQAQRGPGLSNAAVLQPQSTRFHVITT